jgi:hypothetical protein
MNFENRVNSIHPGNSVEEVARAFFTGTFPGNGLQIGQIIFVDDSDPSGTGAMEVAVVDQGRGKIESITVGWCRTLQQVIQYFNECLDPAAEIVDKNIRVPLSESEITDVYLECGCCGKRFHSLFERQKKFDQDTGFGICSGCEQFYS